MAKERSEKVSNSGKIIVVTGRTGSGKDFLTDELEHMMADYSLSRVVTHATRQPRDGEIDGVHYHFCSEADIHQMHANDELVEKPVDTGTSLKATSKQELLQVLEGNSKIWRIDLSLAAKIARGDYYHNQFDDETATILSASTMVLFIDVEQGTLDERRKSRDRDKYDPKEYFERDRQELEIIDKYGHYFATRVSNPNGEVEITKENIRNLVEDFMKN